MKKKASVKKSVPVKKKVANVAASTNSTVKKLVPAIPAVQGKPTTIAVPAKPSVPVKPAIPVVLKKRTLYIEVTPDKYFVLCDGRKIKNAKELADVLQVITDDMFKYHVTDTKNDFSNWINDVFGEPDLAKKMKALRNRLETSIELYRYMFDKLDKVPKK